MQEFQSEEVNSIDNTFRSFSDRYGIRTDYSAKEPSTGKAPLASTAEEEMFKNFSKNFKKTLEQQQLDVLKVPERATEMIKDKSLSANDQDVYDVLALVEEMKTKYGRDH